jgi:serine/threonine protein kinase
MHRYNVNINRNIKPENFYYESDQKNAELKIINFGKACRFVPS